jgi:hypothetical protein
MVDHVRGKEGCHALIQTVLEISTLPKFISYTWTFLFFALSPVVNLDFSLGYTTKKIIYNLVNPFTESAYAH